MNGSGQVVILGGNYDDAGTWQVHLIAAGHTDANGARLLSAYATPSIRGLSISRAYITPTVQTALLYRSAVNLVRDNLRRTPRADNDVTYLPLAVKADPVNRVLLTGSRTWADRDRVEEALNAAAALGPMVLVHGACPSGADAIAAEWAHHRGVPTDPHPADWDHCAPECPDQPHRIQKRPDDVDHPGELDTYCPAAGPRRNKAMVDLGATVCLAFLAPGSRGTRNCLGLARKAGIKTQTWSA